jgi:23S rRNA pseudouridine2605 synthase
MPPVRLHKLLAQAGVASRRAAERLIVEGRVHVNGVPVVELGAHADPEQDRIEVDGRRLPQAEPKRYVLLHKPRGYLTTREDPRGRPRVFDLVPQLGVRLHPVGRLDYDAEGLLLLTNDGTLTFRLTHPRHGVRRVYHVLVAGRLGPDTLPSLQRGVVLEDGPARVDRARILGDAPAGRHWVELQLSEGRYREVKRLCRAVGLVVERLRRVAFGTLELGDLPEGQWRELGDDEVARLSAGGSGPPPARSSP